MTTNKPTKIGDRVRYLGQIEPNAGESTKPVGTLGTVAVDNGYDGYHVFPSGIGTRGDIVNVEWDNDLGNESTYMSNVELVEPTPGTRAYTAAELRTKAAEMRTLRDEKYADAGRLTDEAEDLDHEASVYARAADALEKIK